MKTQTILFFAVCTIVTFGTPHVQAADLPATIATSTDRPVDRAYQALGGRTRRVVENYLRTDCEVGEVGKALLALVPFAERATPYLKAVIEEGPPSQVTTALDSGLKRAWRKRVAFLKTPDALELGEESFKMMQAITEKQYFDEQRSSLQAKYRERASVGLERLACLQQAGKDGVDQCITPIKSTADSVIR
jgi:hypothetical protein